MTPMDTEHVKAFKNF